MPQLRTRFCEKKQMKKPHDMDRERTEDLRHRSRYRLRKQKVDALTNYFLETRLNRFSTLATEMICFPKLVVAPVATDSTLESFADCAPLTWAGSIVNKS